MNPEHQQLHSPLDIVCPICRSQLRRADAALTCDRCQQQFSLRDGFPDLIVGGRFEDDENPQLLEYEEACNTDTTNNYWLPLLNRITSANSGQSRVLSVGCGTGVDVDILSGVGYSAFGVDCGNRTSFWTRRQQKSRLVMANGKHLPFESESIDVAFCGCVFPHVGVVGDSYKVGNNYFNDRLELAREMARVVRPGGHIVVSSPNRNFPFDLFHGRNTGSYRPRPYWPGDKFLLSVGDYRRLFQMAGCGKATALPVEGYWGFIRARHTWKGLLLGMPVRLMFWLVSHPLGRPLRGSPFCPWIVVQIDK